MLPTQSYPKIGESKRMIVLAELSCSLFSERCQAATSYETALPVKTDRGTNTWLEMSRIKLVPFAYAFCYGDNNVRVLVQLRFKPFLDFLLSIHFCLQTCIIQIYEGGKDHYDQII